MWINKQRLAKSLKFGRALNSPPWELKAGNRKKKKKLNAASTNLCIYTIWDNSVLLLPSQIISAAEFGETPEKKHKLTSYTKVLADKDVALKPNHLYFLFFDRYWTILFLSHPVGIKKFSL